jgi:hypothetical protein
MFDCGLGNAYRSVICLQKNECVSIEIFTGRKDMEGCDMLIDVYSSHSLLFCVTFVYCC